MTLSVIVPTLNEASEISSLIDCLLAMEPVDKQLIFTDGGSQDDTCQIIRAAMQRHPNILLVHNPDKYVSHGFNRAFPFAKGQFIALIGAHAIYPANYFLECIQAIEAGICDVAGGFLRHEGRSTAGRAIARAMSDKLGVGNTAFRTQPKRQLVDSVAFAVYHRRVFDKAGLLDESLVRNQDDAFHYRLNHLGFRILLIPTLVTTYWVRDSLPALWRQYYGYGFYKPLVFKKVRSGMRWRHLAPPAFVLYWLTLPAVAWWHLGWLLPGCLYGSTLLAYTLVKRFPIREKPYFFLAFPTLHLAYGAGFLSGIWHWRH